MATNEVEMHDALINPFDSVTDSIEFLTSEGGPKFLKFDFP